MRVCLFVLLWCATACGQGVFSGSNASGRTRIGSISGPLAGTNIFGQFFAGGTESSLTPVGVPRPHFEDGVFAPGVITVPGLAPFTTALVQLVVWDSTVWGEDRLAVPSEQFGRTDVGTVLLTDGDFYLVPQFTQPAIVPIPEPRTWALVALGAVGLWFVRRRRK